MLFLKHALKALTFDVEDRLAPRLPIVGTNAVGGPVLASTAAAPSNHDSLLPKATKPTASALQTSKEATATQAAPATGNTDAQSSLPTPATQNRTVATKHTAHPQIQTPVILKKLKRKHKNEGQYPGVKRKGMQQRETYLVIDHSHKGFVHKCTVH